MIQNIPNGATGQYQPQNCAPQAQNIQPAPMPTGQMQPCNYNPTVPQQAQPSQFGTPPNMQVPPPVVTGIEIPNYLNTDRMSYYQKNKALHQEAVNDFNKIDSKNKRNDSVNKVLRFAVSTAIAVGSFFGIKKLIHIIKK